MLTTPVVYSDHIYRNGICVDPETSLTEKSTLGPDLDLVATVNFDNSWEGIHRREKKVQSFTQKQVDNLTALLRSNGINEEEIADCLSGTYETEMNEKSKSTEALVKEDVEDVNGKASEVITEKFPSDNSDDAGDANEGDGEGEEEDESETRVTTSSALDCLGLDDDLDDNESNDNI